MLTRSKMIALFEVGGKHFFVKRVEVTKGLGANVPMGTMLTVSLLLLGLCSKEFSHRWTSESAHEYSVSSSEAQLYL
jgi:hypothetical protein